MFQLLQESAVPVTDKIFPWVVETALVRVEMEGLQDALRSAQDVSRAMPVSIAEGLARVMVEPIRLMNSSHVAVSELTQQLENSAVLKAKISQSGWWGLVAAMRAISAYKNLAVVVGLIALGSGLVGGWLVWQVGTKNREILDYNNAVIERCYQRFLPRKGTKNWFSCPGFQLPRIR